MMYYMTFLLTRPSFTPRPVGVRFVEDKMTIEQVYFRVFQFCHVTIIPYTYSHSILIYSSSVCIILLTDSAVYS